MTNAEPARRNRVPIGDFASAAMCRALIEGMRMLGLEPPATSAGVGQGRVSLETKRSIVGSAVRQGGLACLPFLGQGAKRFPDEPAYRALCIAGSGSDLLARWQRLERYVHSRHRTRLVDASARHAVVEHVALAGRPRPQAAEDLVVAGMLVALLEAAGATAVGACVGRATVYPVVDTSALARAQAEGRTGCWSLTWDGFAAGPFPPAPSLRPGTEAPRPPPGWPELACRVYERLVADLVRPPAAADLASALGLGTRSMQRQLAAHGLTLTGIAATARAQLASAYLIDGSAALAEIGFLTGHSDQAHFTRMFSRSAGMTPARFRQAFARGS
jgi:AraC-like DNA-binding protein